MEGSAARTPSQAPSAPARRSPSFLKAQLVGWGLFSVVDVINRQLIYQDTVEAIVLTAVAFPVLVALSVLLRWSYDRLAPSGRLDPGTIAMVAFSSVLAALATAGTVMVVREALGWRIPDWLPLQQLLLPFAYYCLVFAAWGILHFWVRAERQTQQARERAAAAQMETLKAEIRELRLQLDPHFLFNALNGLAEEVPEHPEAAVAMVRDLARFMRQLIAGIRSPVVAVAAEVECLGAYMRLQEARFAGRVRARIDLDPAAAERPIVNLLLQPLVENAFEHGDRSRRLDVDVRVAAEGDALNIEIANTGRLAPVAGAVGHTGIGLENVRRRLDVHYPGRHTFALRQATAREAAAEEPRVVAVLRLEGEPCSAS